MYKCLECEKEFKESISYTDDDNGYFFVECPFCGSRLTSYKYDFKTLREYVPDDAVTGKAHWR